MKFKEFTPYFQKELSHAIKIFNEGNKDTLSCLIKTIYQDAYADGYYHSRKDNFPKYFNEKESTGQEPPEKDFSGEDFSEQEYTEQIISNFLNEKLLEFEKNGEIRIEVSYLYKEYSEYCKHNHISGCCENNRNTFDKHVKKILNAECDTWEYGQHSMSRGTKDRTHRDALIYVPKVSNEERVKLNEPSKPQFLYHYTKECLDDLKDSLATYQMAEVEKIVLGYVNEKIDLRMKIGVGKRRGKPWDNLKQLTEAQIDMIHEILNS